MSDPVFYCLKPSKYAKTLEKSGISCYNMFGEMSLQKGIFTCIKRAIM